MKISPIEKEQMANIKSSLDEDPGKHVTIQELAELAGMSKSKFQKLFCMLYELPVHQYQKEMRLQLAKQLLLSREWSVKEVCFKVGYRHLSSFTAAYRKRFKLNPSYYI